jgi:Potential Queuosine, Q, salvage protein family
VLAVERIKEEVAKRGQKLNSVEIDWFLWQTGEKTKDSIKNHHRTLTIFY